MKLFFIALTILSMCLYGCKNTAKHKHATTVHSHEGSSHDHKTEEHTHSHKDHKHEEENHKHTDACHDHNHENHNHENEEDNHNDEIIFTKAQAARTNFKVEEVQPSSFHQIIKTTGQILPAPGDESVLVATHNGTISYANNKLTTGSAVKQGQPLFYITSKNLSEGDYYSRIRANYEKQKRHTNGLKT